MKIRPAVDADRMEIARLHTESWRDAYREILPAALLDETLAPIMVERWMRQKIGPSDAVLVAEEGGALVGFAASWDGDPVYIDNLHVAAAVRSRGIGRRLLAGTARHFLALERSKALLHVVAGNHRARALYLALGGRPDGIEAKDLYGTVVPNERIEWDDLELLLARASET